VWTAAVFDVGLDEIVVLTPCCAQQYSFGAYTWPTGTAILCQACGTPYDVIFEGHLDHGGTAGWAVR
jgi:hypothetical protein